MAIEPSRFCIFPGTRQVPSGYGRHGHEILFSGDAVYDGPLVDNLHHSNVADYARTMLRLRELPARIIHAGHEPSFGRERLIALADAYLENAERQGNTARAGTVAGREPDRS